MPINSALARPQLKHTKVTSGSLSIEPPGDNNIETIAETKPTEETCLELGISSKSRFCALAYASTSENDKLSATKHVILLAIEDSGVLRFLVHPNLKSVVDAIDFPYIQSLLRDFVERINHYATELFRQLCTLAVGPLQAHTVGEQLCKYPDIHDLSLRFSTLEN